MLQHLNHRNVTKLFGFDEDKMILELLRCDMQAVLFKASAAKAAGFSLSFLKKNGAEHHAFTVASPPSHRASPCTAAHAGSSRLAVASPRMTHE